MARVTAGAVYGVAVLCVTLVLCQAVSAITAGEIQTDLEDLATNCAETANYDRATTLGNGAVRGPRIEQMLLLIATTLGTAAKRIDSSTKVPLDVAGATGVVESYTTFSAALRDLLDEMIKKRAIAPANAALAVYFPRFRSALKKVKGALETHVFSLLKVPNCTGAPESVINTYAVLKKRVSDATNAYDEAMVPQNCT